MKLIHCADLHLDACMESGLSREKAAQRRLEILRTFTRMVEHASEKGVDAVLLSGDLFDTKTVSARAKNCVLDALLKHPEITFYYLRGNHDQEGLLTELEELPPNLRTFGCTWTSYEQQDVVITGAEITEELSGGLLERLTLDEDKLNIVMLHGMASEYGPVSLKALKNRNIDYLALGHIHSFRMEKLDDRGVWCYCGCLEGRGFDECGEKGYVYMETRGSRICPEFVPFAFRTLHRAEADISGLLTQEEILRAVKEAVQDIPAKDMVEVMLTGELSLEAEKDTAWIEKWLEHEYYFLRVKDKTRTIVRPEDYRYDISLKGEFVRLVLGSAMTEEEKEQVLRLGIHALTGEL